MSVKAPPLNLPNKGTLLDIAVQNARSHPEMFENPNDQERTLLVVGSESVGKTKLITKILELEDEEQQPTMLLGYLAATRDIILDGGQGNAVCHAWELAGLSRFRSVLEVIRDLPRPCCVVMVDLSEPKTLWHTLNASVNLLLEFLGTRMDVQQMEIDIAAALPGDYPDRDIVTPFPVPLVIVGGKYDLFQSFEPEKKRVICKFLRFFAHSRCASLLFYGEGKENAKLIKRLKDFLHHYAFGTERYNGLITIDSNSAIVMPAGSDAMADIDSSMPQQTISHYLHLLETHFPQEDPMGVPLPDDPASDENFREPTIDALRKQKDEEFELYMQEKERKQKMLDELGLEEEETSLAPDASINWNFNIE